MGFFHHPKPTKLISVPEMVTDTWCSSWLLAGFSPIPFGSLWQCVESVLMCLLHTLEVRFQQLWNTGPALTHVESQGEKEFTPSLNKQ